MLLKIKRSKKRSFNLLKYCENMITQGDDFFVNEDDVDDKDEDDFEDEDSDDDQDDSEEIEGE